MQFIWLSIIIHKTLHYQPPEYIARKTILIYLRFTCNKIIIFNVEKFILDVKRKPVGIKPLHYINWFIIHYCPVFSAEE